MKKALAIALTCASLLTFTGCGKENIQLDLSKVKEDLSVAKKDGFYLGGVSELASNTDYFEGTLEYVYDFDYSEKLGLTKENIKEESSLYYDENTKELLAVLAPADGKKEDVKTEMNTFLGNITDKENKMEEYQGYLVYVVSKDNEKLLKAVKDVKEPIFGAMMEVTKENVKDTLNIYPASLDEFLMETPMMIVQSNTYIIVRPASGKEQEVKDAINAYMKRLEEQWKTYLPDQYELVKNRKEEKLGDYLIYIVSSDNEKVFNTIKASVK